ncbi:MAG: NAD(P)/FAD-dependent oxidoreductase [Gammaproteobacteria bacterium]|nr:NAD(P)/FAD-dependent oxidoreductase [Gammaproteobacteria bacterium]
MSRITRRNFVLSVGAVSTATSVLGWPALGQAKASGGRVVVIGGGFGGATCAKYLRRLSSDIKVTLVERDANFVTCPLSNAVLGGLYDMDFITHDYKALRDEHGVKVVHDSAVDIDPDAKKVRLAGGSTLKYDRLVVSPGIDLQWDAIEGYNEAASATMPHAWQAGEQTMILRRQLEAMPDGGVVIIAPPPNPFRCPPGPYERASLIAHYLKNNKPRAKIRIFDAKPKFSKQPLFEQGWQALYPGMIEWISETEGGAIDGVDVKAMAVKPTFGEPQRGDVVNVIPPQRAGAIAEVAGLTNDSGWCPIDQRTFESRVQKHIHVIGDAAIANPMPKSGYAASSQGKVCATAIVASLSGQELPEPSYVNTCYSLVGPDYGISVAAVYRLGDDGIAAVEGAGGVSPKDADAAFRLAESRYAVGWYQSITSDIWG